MTEKCFEEISAWAANSQKACESLLRLQRQGTTESLCNLLSKIVQDENTFIQNESQKEGKSEANNDLLENFKDGLNELVSLIIGQTCKPAGILKENFLGVEKNNKVRLLNVQLEKSSSEILDTSSSKSRLLNVSSYIPRHQSNERNNDSKNKVHTQPDNQNSSFNYRSGLLQIKSYRKVPLIGEDLYQRLQSKHKMRSRDQNNSFDTSFRLPSIKNGRIKSGKRDMSFEHINSEFNFIKGAVSFGNSKRKIFIGQADIPGPATYKTETCTPRQYKKPPNPIIGKAPKLSWIDAFSRNDSPGPGHLYPSKHLVLK